MTISQRVININPTMFVYIIIPVFINRFNIRIPAVKRTPKSVKTAILKKRNTVFVLIKYYFVYKIFLITFDWLFKLCISSHFYPLKLLLYIRVSVLNVLIFIILLFFIVVVTRFIQKVGNNKAWSLFYFRINLSDIFSDYSETK